MNTEREKTFVTKRIGFVGAGKVGCSFGRYIMEEGDGDFAVSGYFSRDPVSARAAADFTGARAFGSLGELAVECDLLLLTVPDGQIVKVWEELAKMLSGGDKAGLCVGHCSGSLSSEIFAPGGDKAGLCVGHCSGSLSSEIFAPGGGKAKLCVGHCSGSLSSELFAPGGGPFSYGSMHPLLSVPDRENSFGKFYGAYFTVEGDKEFVGLASSLLSALGNPFCQIDAARKNLYHAACVVVSNLVCGLACAGTEIFKGTGLDDEFAENAWRSLFLGNAENISDIGPVQALTGPIERGDAGTVARHLDALTGDTKEIYLLLSRVLIDAAQRKNPGRDYSELRRLLGAPR